MRVCINAAAANAGGSLTYLINLVSELAALDTGDHYLVVAPNSTLAQLDRQLAAPCFDAEAYPYSPFKQVRRLLFDQLRIPPLIRRYRADVLFSANGFGSLAVQCPEALLIRNPMFFSPVLEERLRSLGRSTRAIVLKRAWSRLSIRSADVVLFPTQAMKGMVEAYTVLRGKPCSVIHYGFDRERFFSGELPELGVLEPLQEWRGAGRKTLLYVAGYAVHKNFETAVEAFASLLAQGLDLGLVLTAVHKDWGDMAELDALLARIRELGIEAKIHFPGEIPWHQLQPLYAAADLFLFPSFLESFGHPMVEAMASGLPVVAADTAVNREILGDAALYFSAFEIDDCARALRRCLDDTSLASRLQGAGSARSAAFSWRLHTEAVLEVLAGLAGRAAA